MSPVTYPARPTNGGPLPLAPGKTGEWKWEPKYNGWRALVHLPSGSMFNRHGDELTIASEFAQAVLALRSACDVEWLDCEALERRHGIGRGCLVVLDVVSATMSYLERKEWLCARIPVLPIRPNPKDFPLVSQPGWVDPWEAWGELAVINHELGAEFYEGLISKKASSVYPMQLRNPETKFPHWVKHRMN